MKSLSLSTVALACLFLCVGCQPKGLDVHAVEGVVTLDGSPFSEVTVTLYPTDSSGEMGFANTNAQGQYRISAFGGAVQKGTTLGTYKVAFNKIVPDGRVPTAEESDAPDFNPAKFPGMEKTKDIVPKKYQASETSGFDITVKPGKNVYDFALLSK